MGEYRTSTASLIVPSIEMMDPSSKTRTDCGIRLNAGRKHAGGGCSRIRSGGSNTLPVRCDAAIASGYRFTSVVGVWPAGVLMTPFGQSCLSTTPAVVDGVRRMGVAQPVNRIGEVDAGALGRLFDDKIDGTLGQWIAGLPNGPEHYLTHPAGVPGADAGALPRLANRRVAITAGISTSRLLLPLPTIESCASPNLTLGVFTDWRPFSWMVAFFVCGLRLGRHGRVSSHDPASVARCICGRVATASPTK